MKVRVAPRRSNVSVLRSHPTYDCFLASPNICHVAQIHKDAASAWIGWREDGFCLMYDLEDRLPARLAVVDLARRFGQGAIFDYAPAKQSGDVALVRTTVPAKSGPEVRQVVTVWRTTGIPGGEAAVNLHTTRHLHRFVS